MKLLNTEEVKFGKLSLARGDARGQVILLADVEKPVAEKALAAWKKLEDRLNGFQLSRCKFLPELIDERSDSSRSPYDRENYQRRGGRDTGRDSGRDSGRDRRDQGRDSRDYRNRGGDKNNLWSKRESSSYGGRR